MDTAESETPHSTPDVLSDIKHSGHLAHLAELFDIETDELLRTEFCYVDRDQHAWYGQAKGIPKLDMNIQDMVALLRPVADEIVFPLATPDLTAAPDDAFKDTTMFIKRGRIQDCAEDGDLTLIPRVLIEEVEILEFIKQHPHPNIVQYNGCIIRRGRVVGIALTRLDILMDYRFRDDPRELDIEACMAGLRAGVQHLHELGLAHNDIKPSNIGFTKDDEPVLLDFGSCKRIGERLISGGTEGWTPEPFNILSATSSDEFALEKMDTWLREQKEEHEAHESSSYESSEEESSEEESEPPFQMSQDEDSVPLTRSGSDVQDEKNVPSTQSASDVQDGKNVPLTQSASDVQDEKNVPSTQSASDVQDEKNVALTNTGSEIQDESVRNEKEG